MNSVLLRKFMPRGTVQGGVALSLGYKLTPALVNGETLVRATEGRYTDQDLVVRTAAASQAMAQGMRVVSNRVTGNSDNLTNGSWTPSNGGTGTLPTATYISGTRPDGASGFVSRLQLSCGAGTTTGDISTIYNLFIATFCVGSLWVKSNTASSQKVTIILASTAVDITATTFWQRFSLQQLIAGTNLQVAQRGSWKDANTADILVCQTQAEDVTGQTNTAPGDYVSVGVLSAPFHGLGIDGSKAFSTLNGNTVASNVVSENVGALISSSIRQGLLVEPAATDLLTARADARDMTTANWALGATCTRARTATGMDGVANKATTLTFGTVAATNTILTTITAAASSRTYSAGVKRRTGTGVIRMTQDGFATNTDITALINSSTFTVIPITQSQLNAQIGFKGDTNLDAIDVDWNQFEAGAAATSRIPEAISTRNASVASRTIGGEVNQTAGTLYVDFIQPVADAATRVALALDDGTANNRILIYTISGVNYCLITVGGVAKFSASLAAPAVGARTRIAFPYAENDGIAYQNNVAMTISTAGTTLPTVTTIRPGNGASISQLGSTIAEVVYYPSRKSNADAQALSVVA